MDAYMYQAALFCPECIKRIKATLDARGDRPANPDDERSFDADDYPKGPLPNGGGEADSFQHCGQCSVFLDSPLTTDGVKYTVEALGAYVDNRRGNVEVLDVWARNLWDFYSLKPLQRQVYRAYQLRRSTDPKLANLPT